MFKRHLKLPILLEEMSSFLLGPRQTGKSTLIEETLSQVMMIDLLSRKTFQQLASNPDILADWVMNTTSEIIVIDEVQKLPSLLDVVQKIIFTSRGKKRFLLTGSSARKLKREGVNLLGGRAREVHLHPLLLSEIGSPNVDEFVQWGTLPSVVTLKSRRQALESYVSLYLDQEIRAEALSRNIENFSRFLEVAAISNSQQVNFASLASDVGMSEKTISQWFRVLEDTLIGALLPCFSKTIRRKAVKSPKFFFFDCGVANAILDRFSLNRSSPEAATALENLVFTHLTAWCSYGPPGRDLFYWRSMEKDEVDFILTKDGQPELAIEVKSTQNPKAENFKGLHAFGQDFAQCQKILLCYCEHSSKTKEGIRIEPVGRFLHDGWEEFCQ